MDRKSQVTNTQSAYVPCIKQLQVYMVCSDNKNAKRKTSTDQLINCRMLYMYTDTVNRVYTNLYII